MTTPDATSAADQAPGELQINASTGDGQPVTARLASTWDGWGLLQWITAPPQFLAPPPDADPRDWADPRVGWGIVLPENEGKTETQRAAAEDAPDPIRELLAHRPGAPVFRYRESSWQAGQFLRRYYADGGSADVAITGGETGIGRAAMPRYLLLCGGPREIPWQVQYRLNPSCYVGRLDLPPAGLANYVDFLLGRKKPLATRAEQPVVWGVDLGNPDITWLMRYAIAEPVYEKYRDDPQIGAGARHLTGTDATVDKLLAALRAAPPALLVSTSHGMTGPLNDPQAMLANLGLLVDGNARLLRPEELLAAWHPDGAIWYAHACCSAGSDLRTSYKGLVEAGSRVESVLEAVAGLGAHVAPLPTALLGADRPLGAFIGHVEPTFDWTLRDPANRQVLTAAIRNALYDRVYHQPPETVGMAFAACYRLVGELFAQWNTAYLEYNRGKNEFRLAATRAQLAALDRQAMVILGDPTVSLPPLPAVTPSAAPHAP